MAWNLKTWNPADSFPAAWYNRIQQIFGKWGTFGGILNTSDDLPSSANLNDWYIIQDTGKIYIYTDQGWTSVDMSTWTKVVGAPLYTDNPFDLVRTTAAINNAIAYFTTSLQDVISGVTPEGFPGSVTAYGLRQSDDGSLVVTEQPDDIPFAGVTSFAVEEGTTNLVEGYGGTGYIGVADIDKPTSYSSSSQPVYKYGASAAYGKAFAVSITDTVVANGESLSVSGWIKYVDGDNDYPNLYINPSSGNAIYAGTLTQVPKDGKWHYFTKTWTNDTGSDVTVTWVWADIIGDNAKEYESYAFQIQVEKKPFATSFVDGSRPRGKLIVPSSQHGFDPDNWVAAAWVKWFGHDSSPYPRIFDMADGTSSTVSGWAVFFRPEDNALRLAVGASGSIVPNLTLNDYLNNWCFIVAVFVDGEQHLYVYCENGLSGHTVMSQEVPDVSGHNFHIGCVDVNDRSLNGLISNLYIGKAKVNEKLIWDDDFVQYVYNLQRPFIVG